MRKWASSYYANIQTRITANCEKGKHGKVEVVGIIFTLHFFGHGSQEFTGFTSGRRFSARVMAFKSRFRRFLRSPDRDESLMAMIVGFDLLLPALRHPRVSRNCSRFHQNVFVFIKCLLWTRHLITAFESRSRSHDGRLHSVLFAQGKKVNGLSVQKVVSRIIKTATLTSTQRS